MSPAPDSIRAHHHDQHSTFSVPHEPPRHDADEAAAVAESKRRVADFYRIYREMTTRHEIGRKPRSCFYELVATLATLERRSTSPSTPAGRIAGAIVVRFGRRATYLCGASLSRDRAVMAPILRRAKAAGCDWYDLWGVAPDRSPAHAWHGISEFKRKFGGVQLDFVPTMDLVYDAAAYNRYVAAKRRRSAPSRPDAA